MNEASLTSYVDQQGTTLLVAAVLRGRARLFPVESGPMRRRFTERAQREADGRAEAWARELGAGDPVRLTRTLPAEEGRDFDALLAMIQYDLQERETA